MGESVVGEQVEGIEERGEERSFEVGWGGIVGGLDLILSIVC